MKKVGQKSNKSTENTYSEKEMKRYLGVLAESHNENLKWIKEGFQIINGKLDNHTELLEKHSKKLDQHTEMIGTIMEDVSVLKDDMQIVKKELKKKVDYDEFMSLVQRVNKLEKA